jgi:hypothetical protein
LHTDPSVENVGGADSAWLHHDGDLEPDQVGVLSNVMEKSVLPFSIGRQELCNLCRQLCNLLPLSRTGYEVNSFDTSSNCLGGVYYSPFTGVTPGVRCPIPEHSNQSQSLARFPLTEHDVYVKDWGAHAVLLTDTSLELTKLAKGVRLG